MWKKWKLFKFQQKSEKEMVRKNGNSFIQFLSLFHHWKKFNLYICVLHIKAYKKKGKNFKLKAHTISLKGNNSNKIRSKRKMLIINEPSSEKGKRRRKTLGNGWGWHSMTPHPLHPKKSSSSMTARSVLKTFLINKMRRCELGEKSNNFLTLICICAYICVCISMIFPYPNFFSLFPAGKKRHTSIETRWWYTHWAFFLKKLSVNYEEMRGVEGVMERVSERERDGKKEAMIEWGKKKIDMFAFLCFTHSVLH